MFVNNVKQTAETIVEAKKAQIKTTAVLAGAAGTVALAAKNKGVQDAFVKVADKALTSKYAQKAIEWAGKGIKYLQGNPGMAKTIGLVAIPTLLVLSSIASKLDKNIGKIEQKYEDKAKFKKAIDKD